MQHTKTGEMDVLMASISVLYHCKIGLTVYRRTKMVDSKITEAEEDVDLINDEMIEQGVHNYSSERDYVVPSDERVRQKLEWFKDQKLALMMHWGINSQLGIVESWALSDADADWSRHQIDWQVTGEEFKQQYFDLNKTFNPIRFQPDAWAKIAKEAGIRYFLFTTKHHDGFCMWDTQYSDYKITGEDCPFHTHRYADICGHLFEAFRRQNIGIAAYFSKADWHIDSYWNTHHEKRNYQNRGPSYNPTEFPEEWERFVQFTHNQIMELGTGYGKIDIMWFDAGWVCKENNQDIRLGEVIDRLRKVQPGMLCADRTVGGAYENYVTPEQCVPDKPLNIPWESCITMGNSFSYEYDDTYKDVRQVLGLLIDIVAKGGNLAINVAPQPDGRLPKPAVKTLKEMGQWLSINGEAIYETRVKSPYKLNNIAFTCNKEKVYAIEYFDADDAEVVTEVLLPITDTFSKITSVATGKELNFTKTDKGYIVQCEEHTKQTAPIARCYCLT